MIYILIGIAGAWIWITYEMKNAPIYDETTGKFYTKEEYDSYKRGNTTEKTNGQALDSGASRNKKSAKRSSKTQPK